MTSRPWRYLAVLVGLLIVMFATIIGNDVAHPGTWHDKFKVGLGLDLSSGTTVTIRAVPLKEHGKRQTTPSSSAMTQSIAILNSRVNGQGFTGAKVQQQGSNLIVVSVPGKSAEQISPLLSSAVLRFRQVLLASAGQAEVAAGAGYRHDALRQPQPVAEFVVAAGGSASPSPSPSASGGSGQAAGAHALGAAGHAKASGSASPSPVAVGIGQPERSGFAEPQPDPEAHQAAGDRRRRLRRHHEDHQQGRDRGLQQAQLRESKLAEADIRRQSSRLGRPLQADRRLRLFRR